MGKGVGALALGLLLTGCTSLDTYIAHLPAPSSQAMPLWNGITQSVHDDVKEEAYVYASGHWYALTKHHTERDVYLQIKEYLTLLWREQSIYDIHTHPGKSMQKIEQSLPTVTLRTHDEISNAIRATLQSPFKEAKLADEEFVRYTPSPTDIASLVRRTVHYEQRQYLRRTTGDIRFFVATHDNENTPILIEYALTPQAHALACTLAKTNPSQEKLQQVVASMTADYKQRLANYRKRDKQTFAEFQELTNTQSPFFRLNIYNQETFEVHHGRN